MTRPIVVCRLLALVALAGLDFLSGHADPLARAGAYASAVALVVVLGYAIRLRLRTHPDAR